MRHQITFAIKEKHDPCGGASLIKQAATCEIHCAVYQYASISNSIIGSCIVRTSHVIGGTIGVSYDGLTFGDTGGASLSC